jgi:putative transposase
VERAEKSLALSVQAQLLSLSRDSLYYQARPISDREVSIKHQLDVLYTDAPFLGSRKIVAMLLKEGIVVGRHTIRRYRAEMGLETLYPKPRLSLAGNGMDHRVYPYLLRGLAIERANQVWGVDITYIRLRRGFMYLVAFLDWYSRFVVAWELSDTLEMEFVLACCEEALGRAVPQIVNSDQGSHFTSERFTALFVSAGTAISMDGRGRCMDNIFTERLWRSVKYEEVYLSEYETPRDARSGLSRYLRFYNEARPHQALGYRTPAEIYYASACLEEEEHSLNSGPKLS